MADTQMTYSQKFLLKILLYALGVAFVIVVTGGILGNNLGDKVMALAAVPAIVALFTFIAFLVSLARSKKKFAAIIKDLYFCVSKT